MNIIYKVTAGGISCRMEETPPGGKMICDFIDCHLRLF